MHAGVAVSTHPVAATATGEAAGQLLERGFDAPDLLCCFVTSAHAGALEDIAAALRTLLSPTALLGAASAAVVATATLVERGPGLVLWAADVGPTAAVRLGPDGAGEVPPDASGLIVLADPGLGGCDRALGTLNSVAQRVALAGALVTPARAAGGSLLTLNGSMYRDGAVGVALGPAGGFAPTLSPGTRAIGPDLAVTSAAGPMIYELDNLPARQRLERLARDELPATDIAFINDGLLLRVGGTDHGRVYPVAGADTANGAIALGPLWAHSVELGDERGPGSWELPPGTVAQFLVHDRAAELGDLRRILASPRLDAALVFPSPAPPANRPSEGLGDRFGSVAVAGCSSEAALGWLGGFRGAHHRAAAVACFYDEGRHPGDRRVTVR